MITPQAQIKINLPLPLKEYLQSKASRFGMPLAGYIRHLVLKDVADMEYPTFRASEKAEKAYRKAKEEEKKGRLVQVNDVEKFFEEK